MSRTVATGARARLALVLILGCAIAGLTELVPAGESPSAVVLAAAAMALVSSASTRGLVAASAVVSSAPPVSTPTDVPVLLDGRATDPVHHPLRPRAPGLA
jgi:hypothetical protein